LCCEIVLETYHIEKVSDVLRKAGIGIHSVPKKKVGRRKKEEVEKTENRPKKKVFQYDGKLLFAANQLAVKLFHLNPKRAGKGNAEDEEVAGGDLEVLQRTPDDRRERPGGGSLGGVRPLSKGRVSALETRRKSGAPAEAGNPR
jgi:hypothetical protein